MTDSATRPRRLAAALGLLQVLNWGTTYYLPAVVAGPVAAEFGIGRAGVLGAFSWALLVGGLCAPQVGRRIERSGGRDVLLLGSLVQGGGLALLALAPGLAGWYAAWTVLGAGMSLGLYDAAFAATGRHLGAAARPAIVGITLLGGFASTVGWPVGSWMFAHAGWRRTALIYAALQIVLGIPLVLAALPRAAPPAPPQHGSAAADGTVTQRAAFRLLAVFFTLRAFVAGVVTVHALTLLAGLGLSRAEAVFAAALIGPAQVGVRALDWVLGPRVSPLLGARIGAALMPLGALAPFVGAPATLFAVAYGLSNGLLTINRGTLPLSLLGARGYARAIGQLALPVLIAQALAPTLAAPLLAWPVTWLLGGIAALSALALLCLVPLRA